MAQGAATSSTMSGKMLAGTMLMGFGIFNITEGIIDHHILGIHHVNELVPPEQWIYWDSAFLVWGALMLAGGCFLLQAGEKKTAAVARESSGIDSAQIQSARRSDR